MNTSDHWILKNMSIAYLVLGKKIFECHRAGHMAEKLAWADADPLDWEALLLEPTKDGSASRKKNEHLRAIPSFFTLEEAKHVVSRGLKRQPSQPYAWESAEDIFQGIFIRKRDQETCGTYVRETHKQQHRRQKDRQTDQKSVNGHEQCIGLDHINR